MIHGLIAVNKEKGLSSHAVVAQVRRLFHTKKAGHFGTLDPAATGLLLIALGQATRFFDFYVKQDKLYSGLIRFGYATRTYDSEGPPLAAKQAVDLGRIDLEALLAGFRGKRLQMPPAFSAKKFKGKPLYTYARRDQPVSVAAVEVSIHELTGRVLDNETLEFRALTSSGTYIRSLAHDLGQVVGCGAYLLELKREKIGAFTLEQAVTLGQAEALAASGKRPAGGHSHREAPGGFSENDRQPGRKALRQQRHGAEGVRCAEDLPGRQHRFFPYLR